MNQKVTVSQPFDQPLRWVKQNSPPSRYAVATLRLEPTGGDAPAEFVVALPPARPDGEPWSDLDLSCIDAAKDGVLSFAAAHGLVGTRVSLTSVTTHEVDSEPTAFREAAKMSMGRALETYGVPFGQAAPARPAVPPGLVMPPPPPPAAPSADKWQRIKATLSLAAVVLACVGLFAYQWYTRLTAGYYYPKAAFFSAMFTAAFLQVGIIGLVRPDALKTPTHSTPEAAKAYQKRTEKPVILVIVIAAIAACLNAYLISR